MKRTKKLYQYVVTYVYEDKNGAKGNGRIFINRTLPIKTKYDILEIDEFLKQEYGFKTAFITNYIKLKYDKKARN